MVVAHRFSGSVAAAFMICTIACEQPPTPHYDPALPEPAGTSITLRGGDDARLLAMDSPVALTFANDERFFSDVSDAALLARNGVAVADNQTGEIFVFDSTGAFVRAIGRTGSGPGEFQNLSSIIAVGGDTIVAFDSQTRIVSIFSPTGEFLEGYRINTPPEASPIGAAKLEGSLGPHRFLIRTYVMPTEEILSQPPNQVGQVPVIAFAFDPAADSSVVVGTFPGGDQWVSDVSGMEATYGTSPFGRRTWVGTLNEKAVVLRNSEPGFRVLLSDGSPYAVYNGDLRAREVTGQDREQFMANWFTSLQEQPYWQKMKSLVEAKGFPETMPYYRDAIAGNDGIVWLEPYATYRIGERTYVGYDSAGVAVGKLRLPNFDRLLEIGDGVAVVLHFADLGVMEVYTQRFRMQ